MFTILHEGLKLENMDLNKIPNTVAYKKVIYNSNFRPDERTVLMTSSER